MIPSREIIEQMQNWKTRFNLTAHTTLLTTALITAWLRSVGKYITTYIFVTRCLYFKMWMYSAIRTNPFHGLQSSKMLTTMVSIPTLDKSFFSSQPGRKRSSHTDDQAMRQGVRQAVGYSSIKRIGGAESRIIIFLLQVT